MEPGLPRGEAEQGEERWYMPTMGERARLLGWRWLYFVPAVLLVPLALVLPFMVFLIWKLLVVAVALPMGALARSARHALRLRTEPFCIHCGYGLTGLPEGHRCPECGVAFSLFEMEEYRRDPHWFIRRRKLVKELPPRDPVFHAGPGRRSRDGT